MPLVLLAALDQFMQRLQLAPVPLILPAASACTSAASFSSGILLTPSSGTGSPDLLQCHCNMRRHSLILVPQIIPAALLTVPRIQFDVLNKAESVAPCHRFNSREGVKFTSKNPTNVFITPRTRLSDLQRSIQRKICSNGRKRIGMIYYRIPISVVAQGVMCGSFAIQADEDLQVLFHCRSQFPEVRTTELFVEMLAPLASSGGSAPGQHSTNVAGPSRRAIQAEPEAQLVTSPTFGIYNEAEAGDPLADLGDTGTGVPQALCVPPVQRVPDPGVVEALRTNDSNDEPPFIEGDSDDDSGPVPNQSDGASSSGTHQYPPHLSTLNLDVLSGPGRVQGEP
ncbi:hypothetical protein PIB30_016611 [Stylosanthes scabra]|uniref:Uncharacterized protein n=1 Tax=Stylosanthes scabra TaxID=79078 RepID=A0ABU6U674_9FABA|nr:hypothetical protein [Stylosanthes scabra]